MKKIKYPYYNIDCGFFPAQIKLCFNDADFQRILKDHKIEYRANALDEGCAETHYFSDGKEGLIVLAIDLEVAGTDVAVVAGTVAHEATHCAERVFEHIGEERDRIGEETRAYLTEHIVAQSMKAIEMYRRDYASKIKKPAREGDRKDAGKKGQGGGGTVPEVDKQRDGGPGQAGVPEPSGAPRGAEDRDGKGITPPDRDVPTTIHAWVPRMDSKEYNRNRKVPR